MFLFNVCRNENDTTRSSLLFPHSNWRIYMAWSENSARFRHTVSDGRSVGCASEVSLIWINIKHVKPPKNNVSLYCSGWEQRKTASGRDYFVNHNNRTTQFTDPRLNGQVLNALRRSAAVQANTSSAQPQVSNGPTAIIRPNNVVEHRSNVITNTAVTGNLSSTSHATTGSNAISNLPIELLESELPKYRRDLVGKLKALRSELQTLQPQSGHCRLEVSRAEIFEESYRLIMKMRPKDMRK